MTAVGAHPMDADGRATRAPQGGVVKVETCAVWVQAYAVRAQAQLFRTVSVVRVAASGAIIAGPATGVGTRHSPSPARGITMLTQNPIGGTLAAPGAPVSLIVSLGPAHGARRVGLLQPGARADGWPGSSRRGDRRAGRRDGTAGIVLSQNPRAERWLLHEPHRHRGVARPPPGDLDVDGDVPAMVATAATPITAIHRGFDIPGDGIDQNCNRRDSISSDALFPTAVIESPSKMRRSRCRPTSSARQLTTFCATRCSLRASMNRASPSSRQAPRRDWRCAWSV